MLKQKRLDDLICYSHLRWGFVYQRPQHLMSRFAKGRRVFFIEEAERADVAKPELRLRVCEHSGVRIVTPVVPNPTAEWRLAPAAADIIEQLFANQAISDHIAWLYTPMALDIMPIASASIIVYDCMDELSLFQGANPALIAKEQELFGRCNLVFTGGMSLYEAKRHQHNAVYPFPSGVDCDHFLQARSLADTAMDQRNIPHPRLGYAGVIDERIDLNLIGHIARSRPDWELVMIGPIAKIDPAALPKLPNIHWLGMKSYAELPQYFAGWDVALMPFAMNDATKYISPTKTPEYLAAGLPVVSTPIRDVVRQYGQLGLVRIGLTPERFLVEAERALTVGMSMKWRERADAFLSTLSWDRTWQSMNSMIGELLEVKSETAMPALSTPLFSGGAA